VVPLDGQTLLCQPVRRFMLLTHCPPQPTAQQKRFSLQGRALLSWVRGRARELGDDRPGVDYAITEVVHCKSPGQFGVTQALHYCARMYTKRVIQSSGARIVVFVGAHAATVAKEFLRLKLIPRVQGPNWLCGRRRMIAFLPHPNSHLKCQFKTRLRNSDVKRLRAFLPARGSRTS
jgi:nitrous oxide reductase accessory protein NosL